jgi:hypothetical protein
LTDLLSLMWLNLFYLFLVAALFNLNKLYVILKFLERQGTPNVPRPNVIQLSGWQVWETLVNQCHVMDPSSSQKWESCNCIASHVIEELISCIQSKPKMLSLSFTDAAGKFEQAE